ncbi:MULTISPECIES: sigma-70 family RNA polymerase sigma factor [unclassified Bacillus (in: firmicutes)]|uniref:sigma-70 family RNA polymerase sigma factor n=1 Tax=unclassified Bacillus (in: firmicutes) TaxID=185979 RepID=UPI001BE58E29|nr:MULTISPECIES: sigma-70 family RNA polymerase sigma factor [unclassified Bacillus (in: firmicutes)]MBT2618499.1 sigma-70 family RNA polymerase sigma factor [Bacillus sp. ISL-78]MBT2632671.1 sigma-70 family RNA polymerase sigma factor [Bacillus sp. ISL-101]
MFHLNTVKKAQKGDDQAFIKLIHKEKEKLYRTAFLYVKNESDSLDIVQDTIYKAYISIGNLKDSSYFSTWLTRILINTALDFIKKNNKVIPIDQDSLERIGAAERLMLEDKMDLFTAIEGLAEKYKTVIILRYYQDLTIKQIAEFLECPEGTVKTNLHRAINELKGKLKEACINE